jgi:hypothetical protein
MRDDRIKLWRHRESGDEYEVRMTDEYKTARLIHRAATGDLTLPTGTYTPADHALGEELAAHSEEYDEIPMREINAHRSDRSSE